MTNRVPYRNDASIRKLAEEFLKIAYLKNEAPIDIESIIEDHLNIDIVVVPNMEKSLGVDCYISGDFKKIMIDERCFEKQETRARFSLAHEVAHVVLHQNVYNDDNVETEEDFIKFMKSLTDDEHRRMEIQAHIFAGFLLLPPELFKQELDKTVVDLGGASHLTISELQPIVTTLSKRFLVNETVIQKQIYDHHKDWLRDTFSGIKSLL
jgi:Zn-dependent peptidase ImmA (M78 family)